MPVIVGGPEIEIYREYPYSDSYWRSRRSRDLPDAAYSNSRDNMDGGVQGAYCDSPHDPGGAIGRYAAIHLGEPQQDRDQSIFRRWA